MALWGICVKVAATIFHFLVVIMGIPVLMVAVPVIMILVTACLVFQKMTGKKAASERQL